MKSKVKHSLIIGVSSIILILSVPCFDCIDTVESWPAVSPEVVNDYYCSQRQRDTSHRATVASAEYAVQHPSGNLPQEEGSGEATKSIVLKFTARKEFRTPPLPPPHKANKSVDDFFASAEYCNLLFSADAALEAVPSPTERIMSSFRRENSLRRIEAGMNPVAQDVSSTRIVRLTNKPMHCLGVTLHSNTFVAVQLLRGMKQNGTPYENRAFRGYPELQVTLLDTEFEATGPKPLTKLFYKIMGRSPRGCDDEANGEEGNDSNSSSELGSPPPPALQTVGFTRIRAEPVEGDDENGKRVVFANIAFLESRMRVRRFLVRFLPMSQAKLEKRGSTTIQNAIEGDIEAGMERFSAAYMKWILS